MARKAIARDKLLGMINDKMASLEACRNLRRTNIEFDAQRACGGNWRATGWQRSGSDHDQPDCTEEIAKFMAELQEIYDISGE
jgi:hypothetical protein